MFIDVVGVLAILFIGLIGVTLVFAQAAKPEGTPAQIERPEPSARATKNPHKAHHHYDVRHEHPKIQNPAQKPD